MAALLALLAAGFVATLACHDQPLTGVPESLLGRWQPASEQEGWVYLTIETASLEWSAGPDDVERRALLGAQRVGRDERTESFALHYLEEGEPTSLRVEVSADGRAHVGGRRSVVWRREPKR